MYFAHLPLSVILLKTPGDAPHDAARDFCYNCFFVTGEFGMLAIREILSINGELQRFNGPPRHAEIHADIRRNVQGRVAEQRTDLVNVKNRAVQFDVVG